MAGSRGSLPNANANVEDRRWPPLTYIAQATAVVLVMYTLYLGVRNTAEILLLVVVAAVLAVGLEPAVQLLMHLRLKRGIAVLVVFFTAMFVVTASIMLLLPMLIEQVVEFAKALPGMLQKLSNSNGIVGDIFGDTDLQADLKNLIGQAPEYIAHSFGNILAVTGRIGSAIFSILSVTILTIYLMLSLPTLRDVIVRTFPRSARRDGARIVDRSIEKIGRYVSGMVVISAISALTAGVALALLGVPYAVPLALWAGFASIVPVIGAYIGGAPAVIVAFSHSPGAGIGTLLFFIIWQQVRDYVVSPPIMRDAVDLSPAAVIVATLIGGKLAGLPGIILALPIAATVKVAVQELWHRGDEEEGSADTDAGVASAPGAADGAEPTGGSPSHG